MDECMECDGEGFVGALEEDCPNCDGLGYLSDWDDEDDEFEDDEARDLALRDMDDDENAD